MSTVNVGPSRVEKPSLNRSGVTRLIQVFGSLLFMGALLFLAAGRLDWFSGWLFLGLYLLPIVTIGLYVARRNPDVINERGRIAENVKPWDKVVGLVYLLLLVALLVVAGLDGGRYRWTAVPSAAQTIGSIGFLASIGIVFWAMLTNPFLSTFVRIQDDRGHYVVTTGPYRYVRHPMYAASVMMMLCIPLVLASLWALVPAGLIMVLFVVRTALEDRTLRAELPGYSDFAERVRYRLLPGVW